VGIDTSRQKRVQDVEVEEDRERKFQSSCLGFELFPWEYRYPV
jgi:hypothetical protein